MAKNTGKNRHIKETTRLALGFLYIADNRTVKHFASFNSLIRPETKTQY